MALLRQSTAYTRLFLMVLTSDHVSPATGKTVTVNLSKAGAAFGAAGGAVAEIANGWYKVSLNTTDTNTLDDLAYNCTASLCDPTDFCDQVGLFDPHSGVIPTVTTVTTTTNLTNAPGAGDFTAAMKTSLNAATPASVTGAVGSVTGNVGGSVGSVTAAVSLSSNDSPVVHSGTAQAGAASTITLAAGASATDNIYNGQTIKTVGGTGPGQVRIITGYVGSTKVATVDRAWATNPDVTTTYAVLATDHPKTNSSLEVVSASVTGAAGSVTGAVGSVTGAVGSVTGSVGSVTGAVGSVTARVTANADQWAGGTIPAPNVTGVPKVDLVDISGAAVSTSSAQLGVNAVQIGAAVPGSATIGTATNLTNAPPDSSGTTTLLGRVTAGRATNLDNLDATVSGQGNPTGAVASGTNSATVFATNRTESTNDYWKDALIVLTSGVMSGQVKKISAYNGTTKEVTVSGGFTGTPADGVTFLLVDR